MCMYCVFALHVVCVSVCKVYFCLCVIDHPTDIQTYMEAIGISSTNSPVVKSGGQCEAWSKLLLYLLYLLKRLGKHFE